MTALRRAPRRDAPKENKPRYDGDSPGVLMTWGQIDDTYGYTGYVGNTVLADAVPSTTSGTWSGWADAAIAPGSSFEFNLQSSAASDFPIVITVGEDDGSGTLEVTVAATDTQAPSVTPQPTDIPPTLAPTTDAEKCGDSDGYAQGTCCASMTVGGVSYLKMAGECCYGGCAYQNADGSDDYIYSYYSTWYGNPFYPCAIEYYTHGPYPSGADARCARRGTFRPATLRGSLDARRGGAPRRVRAARRGPCV